jgi:hypothetical protein
MAGKSSAYSKIIDGKEIWFKICTKCGIEKEISYFEKGRCQCKECRKLLRQKHDKLPHIKKNNVKKVHEWYINNKEHRKEYNAAYNADLENKAKKKEQDQLPKNKERRRKYDLDPVNIEKTKLRNSTPEAQERRRLYEKERRRKQILKYTPDDFKDIYVDKIPSHLYIVKHKTHPTFKIGITKLLDTRVERLNINFGECELIYKFTASGNTCRLLETSLKIEFEDNQYKDFLHIKNGGTEWFHNECLEDVLSHINDYNEV